LIRSTAASVSGFVVLQLSYKLPTKKQSAAFAASVLEWFEHSGRKDLPWQQDPTPYRVWISEIMLQQTQVSSLAG